MSPIPGVEYGSIRDIHGVGIKSMVRRLAASCFLTLALLLSDSMSAVAGTNDPHELYEQRCGTCHEPHGGDFVSKHLRRVDSKLLGRHTGKELRTFLEHGHGELSPDEVDVMVLHLTSILDRGALYREKCLICHDRAVLLARLHLIMRDGRLVGRYTGRDIGMFLENHGRLEKAEMSTILEMLATQLSTQRDPID